MQYLATFFTHSGALKYQNHLKRQGIPVELMPVPRKLSSSCGIAAQFGFDEDIRSMISEDIESLYEIKGMEYKLIYRNT
ncbi:MAG: DUF3343 domain-containing protein [Gracilibacteraceae bacterium]|jgi:hypothetical protein|nr:DUF3343 domain-containing protein [Gracilibacteraceae bacterium]